MTYFSARSLQQMRTSKHVTWACNGRQQSEIFCSLKLLGNGVIFLDLGNRLRYWLPNYKVHTTVFAKAMYKPLPFQRILP